jgi:LPXTG-motif cell wall-anchored protein
MRHPLRSTGAALMSMLIAAMLIGLGAFAGPATAGQSAKAMNAADHAAAGQSTNAKNAADHGSAGTAGTSGDVHQPQPLSGADQNTGGANGKCPGGPYCSTRDGSPSQNGRGDGKATGKPCAGCVGKADNKNPAGQYPNGTDANAGYECDRNSGVGQTNPAHTGCRPSKPPMVCVDNPTTPKDECNPVTPPTKCVDNPTTPRDECNPVTPPTPPPGPPGHNRPPPTLLPNTGASANLAAALLLGTTLLGVGMVLLRRPTA